MISHLSRRIFSLLSQLSLRSAILSAGGICLCMLAASAPAQTRPYQMTILGSIDSDDFYTNAGVDVPVFYRGTTAYDQQPAGPSIMWTAPDADLDAVDGYNYHLIDWSRIVAVYVDEPYDKIVKNTSICPQPSLEDPVGAPLAYAVAQRELELSRVAAAVRRKAPRARFWVNFTEHEIDLIRSVNSHCDFNKPYIDVISMDIYGVEFNNAVSDRYNDIYAYHRHSPHQQLALVPGTFTGGSGNQSAANQAARLWGYFGYAYGMNSVCDLPLGPTRVTGIYDRCPVWMVGGWNGGRQANGGYNPIDHPASKQVFDVWQEVFSAPKTNPSKVRAARDLVPLLSDESEVATPAAPPHP